jgi:acyl carrier protein
LSRHLTQSEFEEKARNFIEAQTGYSGERIASDTDLLAEGIVDSLMLVEFFLFPEEVAERDIPSETVTPQRIATLSGAYELLSDHPPDKTS